MCGPGAFSSSLLPMARAILYPAPMRSNRRPVTLLTGFGQFPGVTHNASEDLVEDLALAASRRHRDFRFVPVILPVDWEDTPRKLLHLLKATQPVLALHFGVSAKASDFVIETRAFNKTSSAIDARGRTKSQDCLVPGDRPMRVTTLPARTLLNALHRHGIPASLSGDPGRYLCNAVMYHSQRFAHEVTPRVRSGFIHIPATIDPAQNGNPSRIDHGTAIKAGLVIIETCLDPLRAAARNLST